MNFELDEYSDVCGTSFNGSIAARYKDLHKLFGEPSSGDDYKISGEWVFSDKETGSTVTLYDWKHTSLYDDFLPSVEEFRNSDDIVTFNIGAHSSLVAIEFIGWLNQKLSEAIK